MTLTQPTRRLLIAGAAVVGAAVSLAGVAAIAQQVPETIHWAMGPSAGHEGMVQFSLSYRTGGGRTMYSHTTPVTEFVGLSPAQLDATKAQPVTFRVVRDPGRLECQGSAYAWQGSGECRFHESAAFSQMLQRRGIGQASSGQLFRLTMSNVGTAYVEELARQKYATPSVEDLVNAGDHGANLKYLQEMGAAGYRLGRVEALVRTRDHGVTARYVQELRQAGYANLSADELVRLRDHGVSASWLGAVLKAGYSGLSTDDLVQLRDHGVTASFIEGLQKAGYRRVSARDLVRMRDHGVTASYVQELVAAGYGHLTPDELVELRDRGVPASFVRRVSEAGEKLSADRLIELRESGSTVAARR